MAGSRTEKFQNIFKRCQGLLKSGAMSNVDKPLWYDVYERFPPLLPPSYERKTPRMKVTEILYPEDIIRAKYYRTVVNPGPIDLFDTTRKSKSQRFVEKYLELEAEQQKTGDTTEDVDLFNATLVAMEKLDNQLFRSFTDLKREVWSKQELEMMEETDSFEHNHPQESFQDFNEFTDELLEDDFSKYLDDSNSITSKVFEGYEDAKTFFTEEKLIVDNTIDKGTEESDKGPEHHSDIDPLSNEK